MCVDLIGKYWDIAYITKEEDQRLRDLGLRSKLMATPHERWAAAGIEFADQVSGRADEVKFYASRSVDKVPDEAHEAKVYVIQSGTREVTDGSTMTANEFIGRYGGNPSSLRNQIVEYLFGKLGKPSTLDEIAKRIGRTSTLGPGVGEVCTPSHMRGTLHHIKRRLGKRRLPYAIRESGRDVIMMVHTG